MGADRGTAVTPYYRRDVICRYPLYGVLTVEGIRASLNCVLFCLLSGPLAWLGQPISVDCQRLALYLRYVAPNRICLNYFHVPDVGSASLGPHKQICRTDGFISAAQHLQRLLPLNNALNS